MKKIMIYTKSGFHPGGHAAGLFEGIKTNALIIMLFSLLFCGSLIGSVLYEKANGQGITFLTDLAKYTISEQYNKVFFISLIPSVWISFCCLMGGFCGIGLCLICTIPIGIGVRYALTLSYLLSSFAVKGLGYFCVMQLPGAVIFVTTALFLCELSGKMSKKIAVGLFGGGREESDWKTYGIQFGILCALLLLSAIVDCICLSLFAKLF